MSVETKFTGRAWAFGDDVSIEYISPLRYMFHPEGRGRACLKLVDREFAAAEKDGDLLVAGKMFAHGPVHDHAVLALREAGIAGIIARSFSTHFFRHSIVHGLPIAVYPEILDVVAAGDQLEVDFSTGAAANLTIGTAFTASVPDGPAAEIVRAGGLIPFLRTELAERALR